MALIPDFESRVIQATTSILDVVAFHQELRVIEESPKGMRYPTIHKYKEVDLTGAIFPAVEFINGWTLEFPAGNWVVKGGNVKATINPIAGAFVLQTQSAAYAVTAVGASGATPSDIADAVIAASQSTPIHADAKKLNGATILGNGTALDKWRGS